MIKKTFILASAMLAGVAANAQDTYENARMLGQDLNGTARYVGMGGAMEALGADISTISTNPAGIGMFRHSNISGSLSVVSQQDANKWNGQDPTNASFDQIGFVWNINKDPEQRLNFAFNYHKSRNFNQLLRAFEIPIGQGSLSKLAYAKAQKKYEHMGGYDLGYDERSDRYVGYVDPNSYTEAWTYTQWDFLYSNVYNVDDVNYDPTKEDFTIINSVARDFCYDKSQDGWIADYDFNLSGSISDRFFWGVTFGLHDMKYHGYTVYNELMTTKEGEDIGEMELQDDRNVDATGVDLKLGAIFLPVEESPFRIGLSLATPTWYNVKTSNKTKLLNFTETPAGYDRWGWEYMTIEEWYDFQYYTPWKFGISLGHTIDNYLALGASYEYSDYGSAKNRIYDDFDKDEKSHNDHEMNDHQKRTMKGVSLLKLGAELKPVPSLSVRLGYNYQSSAYEENGFRDTQLVSPGTYYSSTADYINWKDTNRLTCGIGYKYQNVNVDLAYQYSTTNGTLYPFQPNVKVADDIPVPAVECKPSSVSDKKHQVLLTVGYTF